MINQAVTKGLDPNVQFKDSGIEWLGNIPVHWDLKKVKHIVNVNPSKSLSLIDKKSSEKVCFLPMEKVNTDGTYLTDLYKPIKELFNGFTYFKTNDVIFAKITPCFENGKGALLDSIPTKFGFGSTEFHVLRSVHGISIPKYIYYLTVSNLFRKIGEAFMSGAAGQKRVPTDFVESFIVPCPPSIEQNKIVVYLDHKINQIVTLISKTQNQIDLLQEYRTALISEVVTGKIDVRDWEED